jgi:hypothetical protein
MIDPHSLYQLRQQHLDLSDADFVIWANTPVLVATRDEVARSDFLYLLYSTGMYARIVAAQANANAQIAGLAVTALGYLGSPDFRTVKWLDPIMQTCLGGFVAAGVFTAAEVETSRKALVETWAAPAADVTLGDLPAALAAGARDNLRQQLVALYNHACELLDAGSNAATLAALIAEASV